MKFAVVASNAGEYADPKLLIQLAREAELADWDGFFIWDMLYSDDEPLVDTFVALSAIAVSTERIRLGTMALGLGRRRPWKVAREAVTLDMLSNGRLILAVGAGHPSDKALEWKGEVHTLPNSPEAIASWEAAGATWCRCELPVSFDRLSDARQFLRAGPPRNS